MRIRTESSAVSNSVKWATSSPTLGVSAAVTSLFCLPLIMSGCAALPPPPSDKHLEPAPVVVGKAPEFANTAPLPPPPKPTAKRELYSVVVHNIDVQQILFALARDAKMNIDIHPGITGTVTIRCPRSSAASPARSTCVTKSAARTSRSCPIRRTSRIIASTIRTLREVH